MPEVILASSALIAENFDGRRTIAEAAKAGFDGVQLFLDPSYRNAEYRERVIEELRASEMNLVLHLPNEVIEKDKITAEAIVEAFPDARVLIHYKPAEMLPEIEGTTVGWENSLVGPLDNEMLKHIETVRDRVRQDDTFLVFDMGRLLYIEEGASPQDMIDYIRSLISQLDPGKDIIHLADKDSWVLRFRKCMCVLGDGVMKNFLEDVRAFGGMIVFEHEDLQMALDSLEVIRS